MAERSYDPDFKHLSPSGWQRLPRATRDAFLQSIHTPPKWRIWLYCLQVWDKQSRHGLDREEPEPIRQRDIVAALGLTDAHVNNLVYEMQSEGMIHVGPGGRVFPVEQPILKVPTKESQTEAGRKLWAERDPQGYAVWFEEWTEVESKRSELRRIERASVKWAQEAAPVVGPNGPAPEIDGPAPEVPRPIRKKSAHIKEVERETENTRQAGRPSLEEEATTERAARPPADSGFPDPLEQLLEEFAEHIGKSPSQAEVAEIRKALRKAPVDQLRQRLHTKSKLKWVPHSYKAMATIAREDCAPRPWIVTAAPPPDMAVYIDGKRVGSEEDEDEEEPKTRGAT